MPDSTTLKQNQAAARDLNRMLLHSVRTDWSFPTLPPATNTDPDAQVPGTPVSYRERFFGFSDDSDSSTCGDEDEDDSESEEDEENVKFETPDDVATFVQRGLEKRKRRRARAEEEEMNWNGGLCFFLRRRNAWTASVPKDSVQEETKPAEAETVKDKETVKEEEEVEVKPVEETDTKLDPSTAASDDAKPATSPLSSSSEPGIPTPTSTISSPETETQIIDPFSPPPNPKVFTQILFPIAAPLIPSNHRIRESLLSRPDQELYDKLVLDGRTPLVPINLKHMIRVMVSGWKNDGNWPPRSAATASSSIVLPDTATVGKMGRRGFRSSVESVKRALRLSGHAAPAGD
jgi:hypothetical protein